MKIFRHIDELPRDLPVVVTVGTFDGVHLGHRRIIEDLLAAAARTDAASVVLTFDPHPRTVLRPKHNDLKLLTTIDERADILNGLHLENLVIQPFDLAFSKLSSLAFIRDVLAKKMKIRQLIVGYDHRFGRNREGSFSDLKQLSTQYGFIVEQTPALVINGLEVSSTKIRAALADGDIPEANAMLGYDYCLEGKVSPGDGMGSALGFPTANILTGDPLKLIPRNGVYAVVAEVDGKRHNSMLNIGVRPTLHNKNIRTIEAHIFDFGEKLYSRKIRVHFKKRIRDEKKFRDSRQLVSQLKKDHSTIKELFKSSHA